MGLYDAMRTRATVWARTAETETWRDVTIGPLLIDLRELTAEGARRESRLDVPDVTHTARCRVATEIQVGRRLKRASDGAEFVVKNTRTHDRPPPGHMVVLLAWVEPAT